MNFQNLRLSKKLTLGFGVLIAVAAISLGFIFYQTMNLTEVERMSSISSQSRIYLKQLEGNLATARAAVRTFVLTNDPGQQNVAKNALNNFSKNSVSLRALLAPNAPELLANFTTYENAVTTYLEKGLNEELRFALSPETQKEGVEFLKSGNSGKHYTPVVQSFAVLDKNVAAWSEALMKAADDNMSTTSVIVAVSAVFCILFGSLAAWLITRSIGRPIVAMTTAMTSLAQGDHEVAIPNLSQLDEIGDMARTVLVFKQNGLEKLRLEDESAESSRLSQAERLRKDHENQTIEAEKAVTLAQQAQIVGLLDSGLGRLAQGDLTFRIEEEVASDYQSLRDNFNVAVERLSETLAKIQSTSNEVASAADEINMGADDLSKRTEEQASSLEETAATTEQLAASVKASASASRQAADIANEAMLSAQAGGAIAGQAVDAMARIETASQHISDIIRVIDDIAFQTNLLALNAAVEAARAGDSGKGFAVVASEVRTLAQRSSAAAKDISALISSSNTEVSEGVKLVREAGEQLGHILAASQKVAATIAEVSAASGEQANGIDEMSQAVAHLDGMTQQNAALAEESSASATSLTSRITTLNSLVAAFKISRQAPASRRAGPSMATSEPLRRRA